MFIYVYMYLFRKISYSARDNYNVWFPAYMHNITLKVYFQKPELVLYGQASTRSQQKWNINLKNEKYIFQ